MDHARTRQHASVLMLTRLIPRRFRASMGMDPLVVAMVLFQDFPPLYMQVLGDLREAKDGERQPIVSDIHSRTVKDWKAKIFRCVTLCSGYALSAYFRGIKHVHSYLQRAPFFYPDTSLHHSPHPSNSSTTSCVSLLLLVFLPYFSQLSVVS